MMSILNTILYSLNKSTPRWMKRILPDCIKRKTKKFINFLHANPTRVPYAPETYPKGVNLFGYFKAQMGLGQGARLYADAIRTADIPHVLINTTLGNPSSHHETEFDHRLTDHAVFNTNIVHLNAEQLPLLISSYPASTWDKRYQIGVWLWELEIFPSEWNSSFEYLDEIWTPSQFSSQAVARNTTKPVYTIPYGICADIDPGLDRQSFGLPIDQYLYLAMYDANSIMSRKNPLGAIDAFVLAFKQNQSDAGLVIKVNNANKNDLEILNKYINNKNNIIIISKTMKKNEVNSLINCCDAFVSLHRSEGFGLVIAEAMLLGKPAIATNWSANAEFMNDYNSCPVDFDFVDTKRDYYMSRPGQRWANPRIHHAADYMIKLFSDKDYRSMISESAQTFIKTHYSMQISGDIMKSRLKEIGVL